MGEKLGNNILYTKTRNHQICILYLLHLNEKQKLRYNNSELVLI